MKRFDFATGVWRRRYMGERSPEVEAIAAGHRRPDLYLLTNVDTPFVQDGTRDGEFIREWMHETFVAELTAQRRPFRLVSGALQDRFNRAVERIDEVIAGKRRRKAVVTDRRVFAALAAGLSRSTSTGAAIINLPSSILDLQPPRQLS